MNTRTANKINDIEISVKSLFVFIVNGARFNIFSLFSCIFLFFAFVNLITNNRDDIKNNFWNKVAKRQWK